MPRAPAVTAAAASTAAVGARRQRPRLLARRQPSQAPLAAPAGSKPTPRARLLAAAAADGSALAGGEELRPVAAAPATQHARTVLLLACVSMAAAAIHRTAFSVLAPPIQAELGLSLPQMGHVHSALLVGYVLGQVRWVGSIGAKGSMHCQACQRLPPSCCHKPLSRPRCPADPCWPAGRPPGRRAPGGSRPVPVEPGLRHGQPRAQQRHSICAPAGGACSSGTGAVGPHALNVGAGRWAGARAAEGQAACRWRCPHPSPQPTAVACTCHGRAACSPLVP